MIRDYRLPYDEATQGQMKTFYRLQKKKPADYTLSDDGKSLQIKAGGVVKSVGLVPFRDMTLEERELLESERLQRLAAFDVLYEAGKKTLREAMVNFRETGEVTAVVAANGALHDLELQRVSARSAIRSVELIPNPTTNQVLFDEPYETRKLFGAHNLLGKKDALSEGIFRLQRRNFHLWQEYGLYDAVPQTDEAVSPVLSTGEEGTVVMTSGIRARIFFEPGDVNGYLSPLFEVEFVYKDVKYSSAYQAFEAERMAAANQPEIRASLLKTRSYRTIGLLTRKIKEQIFQNPQIVWTGIFNALYEQHSELSKKLLETGQVSLVYASPDVIHGGVGLPHKDKRILDSTKWKGENVVGKVLESIRARLRETMEPVELVAPVAKEAVVTKEAQGTAKKGAIIQARIQGRK